MEEVKKEDLLFISSFYRNEVKTTYIEQNLIYPLYFFLLMKDYEVDDVLLRKFLRELSLSELGRIEGIDEKIEYLNNLGAEVYQNYIKVFERNIEKVKEFVRQVLKI